MNIGLVKRRSRKKWGSSMGHPGVGTGAGPGTPGNLATPAESFPNLEVETSLRGGSRSQGCAQEWAWPAAPLQRGLTTEQKEEEANCCDVPPAFWLIPDPLESLKISFSLDFLFLSCIQVVS